ncbi:MAG: hypothetical protein GY856_25820 [bacterium]|nr:hypothetical protein [bacterium]
MSLVRTIKLYRALSPPQKKIIRDKWIELTMPPERWLQFLGELARFDKEGDASRKAFGWTAGICCVVALISVVFGLPMGIEMGGAVGQLMVILPLAVLGLGILALIVFLALKRIDIANNLRLFVAPLIAILREEMDPKEKLALTMDFRGGTHKSKIQDETEQDPGRFRYPKIKETQYLDPWFDGRAQLADGGALEWHVVDRIRKRVITKKNLRGNKVKTKTKYKGKRLMDVRLGLRQKEYGLARGAEAAAGGSQVRVAVREGESRNLFKLRRVTTFSELDSVVDLDEFLDLLATAYRQVSLEARS